MTRILTTGDRKLRGRVLAPLLVAVLTLGVAACGSDDAGTGQSQTNRSSRTLTQVDQDGTTTIADSQVQAQVDAIPKSQLTAADKAGLVYMREEEKLARDVYSALGAKWNLPIFTNIGAAEQTHMDAVAVLLDRYGLDDPAAGNAAGVFTEPRLQALYTQLVAQGSTSLVDALTVGATIEDLDIADLQSYASNAADVQVVYDNLEQGSRNHLRAFVSQLERNGASYSPAYISQAEYDSITSSQIERGNAR